MITKKATVRNGQGIHCRPSGVIAKKAQQFSSTVTVCADSNDADATKILALIGLGLTQGATVTVKAEGDDEEDACSAVAELIETEFDFPPRN